MLLLGPPGVGKTYLAVAIGRHAILAGCTVLFMPAPTLVAQLPKAHSDGRIEDRLSHFGKPKLLILFATWTSRLSLESRGNRLKGVQFFMPQRVQFRTSLDTVFIRICATASATARRKSPSPLFCSSSTSAILSLVMGSRWLLGIFVNPP